MKLDQLKPRNSLVIGHFVLIKEAVSPIFTVKNVFVSLETLK